MSESEHSHYLRIHRNDVLSLLGQAGISPKKLTAHRDNTFTALYCRSRLPKFDALQYEKKLEQLDPRIAILKRPSELDSGDYIKLQFAIADLGVYGINIAERQPAADSNNAQVILSRLRSISRDMDQLTAYAWDLADGYYSHRHLTLTLEELTKQIRYLNSNLDQLNTYNYHSQSVVD